MRLFGVAPFVLRLSSESLSELLSELSFELLPSGLDSGASSWALDWEAGSADRLKWL